MTAARSLRAILLLLALAACATGCRREAGPPAPERVRAGWDWYSQDEFSLAVREFDAALAAAPPGSQVRLQALYGLATTWALRRPGEDKQRAECLYRQIVESAPTNDLAAWSLLAIARMKALVDPTGDTVPTNAMLAYQEVQDRFPAHPAAEEAFLFQQSARLNRPDAAQARSVLAALERFLAAHPQSPNRSFVHRLVSHCCAILGMPEKRLDSEFQSWRSAENDPANPEEDLSWAYWRIATLAEFETGDFATAREYYRKLIAEYPAEQRVFLAKQELKRMDEVEARIRRDLAAQGGAR